MLVRQPVVNGQFYDGREHSLRQAVQDALTLAASAFQGQRQKSPLVMLPHAGHVYCGDIIAETLARVRLPATVVLLGPNHTGAGQHLAVWPQGQWATPLGPMPVDAALAATILSNGGGFLSDTAAHAHEHALEVLLPFLQLTQPDLSIVPITVGCMDMKALQRAGEALGATLADCIAVGQDVGIVLSSDMHHFSDHETTCRLDALALERFMAQDIHGLAHCVAENKITMCGIFPAILSLYAIKHMKKEPCTLVKHATSGEKNGDLSRVVGYAGLFVAENDLPKVQKDA